MVCDMLCAWILPDVAIVSLLQTLHITFTFRFTTPRVPPAHLYNAFQGALPREA